MVWGQCLYQWALSECAETGWVECVARRDPDAEWRGGYVPACNPTSLKARDGSPAQ